MSWVPAPAQLLPNLIDRCAAQIIFGKSSGCLEEPALSSFLTNAISVVSNTVPIVRRWDRFVIGAETPQAVEFPFLLNIPPWLSGLFHSGMRDVLFLHEVRCICAEM